MNHKDKINIKPNLHNYIHTAVDLA